jgi:hypothetical protein
MHSLRHGNIAKHFYCTTIAGALPRQPSARQRISIAAR